MRVRGPERTRPSRRLRLAGASPGNTLPFVAYDATKGCVDEEEAAQSYLAWASSLLRPMSLVYLAFAVGCSAAQELGDAGAAWRSSVVGYLLFSPEIARVAATSVQRQRQHHCQEFQLEDQDQ